MHFVTTCLESAIQTKLINLFINLFIHSFRYAKSLRTTNLVLLSLSLPLLRRRGGAWLYFDFVYFKKKEKVVQ